MALEHRARGAEFVDTSASVMAAPDPSAVDPARRTLTTGLPRKLRR